MRVVFLHTELHIGAVGREIRDLPTMRKLLRKGATRAERLANLHPSSGFSRRGRRRKEEEKNRRKRSSKNKTIRAEKLRRASPITLTGHALFINADLFTAVTVRREGKNALKSASHAAHEGLNFAGFFFFCTVW